VFDTISGFLEAETITTSFSSSNENAVKSVESSLFAGSDPAVHPISGDKSIDTQTTSTTAIADAGPDHILNLHCLFIISANPKVSSLEAVIFTSTLHKKDSL
jgi:hypothetical protein